MAVTRQHHAGDELPPRATIMADDVRRQSLRLPSAFTALLDQGVLAGETTSQRLGTLAARYAAIVQSPPVLSVGAWQGLIRICRKIDLAHPSCPVVLAALARSEGGPKVGFALEGKSAGDLHAVIHVAELAIAAKIPDTEEAVADFLSQTGTRTSG
jgi:hypothetical protein